MGRLILGLLLGLLARRPTARCCCAMTDETPDPQAARERAYYLELGVPVMIGVVASLLTSGMLAGRLAVVLGTVPVAALAFGIAMRWWVRYR